MDSNKLPDKWRKQVRADGRELIKYSEGLSRAFFEDHLIDLFEERWKAYPPQFSLAGFRDLLKFLIAAGRENRTFCLTMETCLERMAKPGTPYGQVIVDAFISDAVEYFEAECSEHGVHWFDEYLPELPEGRYFAEQAARGFFRLCLAHYCNLRKMTGAGDLLAECWSFMSSTFRNSPYAGEFCKHFDLPLPGHAIGQHVLEAPVGVGGMGVVYLAMHEDNHRVALKLMRPDWNDRSRFVLEARTAVTQDNPRLVRVKETHVSVRESVPYFTMDYVEGGRSLSDIIDHPEKNEQLIDALARHLEVKNPMSSIRLRIGKNWKRSGGLNSINGDCFIAALVRQVAIATQALHDDGFVHCDIKAGNVLLSKKNGPLLGDLGLSRQLASDKRTEPTSFAGTPAYASPEQAGARALAPTSDVYQLGGLLHRALTGRPPFFAASPKETVSETLRRVREDKLPDFLNNECHAHQRLKAVCLKSLSRRPEDRYASAKEMGEDLQNFVKGRPVRARHGYYVKNLVNMIFLSPYFWSMALIFLLIGSISWLVWLSSGEIDGVLAAQNRYRTLDIVPEPKKITLVSNTTASDWPNPKYRYVNIQNSSALFDLSYWKAVPKPQQLTMKKEPALFTRVIQLRKGATPPDGRYKVGFQFRTGGAGVDWRCSSHPQYEIRGSKNQIQFNNGPAFVREIVVDITDDHHDVVTVVLQATIWNGFQENDRGNQWAAFLSPDVLSEGTLAVVFPKGCCPSEQPEVFFREYHDTNAPQPCLTNSHILQKGNNWWAWYPPQPMKDYYYMMKFHWKPHEDFPGKF